MFRFPISFPSCERFFSLFLCKVAGNLLGVFLSGSLGWCPSDDSEGRDAMNSCSSLVARCGERGGKVARGRICRTCGGGDGGRREGGRCGGDSSLWHTHGQAVLTATSLHHPASRCFATAALKAAFTNRCSRSIQKSYGIPLAHFPPRVTSYSGMNHKQTHLICRWRCIFCGVTSCRPLAPSPKTLLCYS